MGSVPSFSQVGSSIFSFPSTFQVGRKEEKQRKEVQWGRQNFLENAYHINLIPVGQNELHGHHAAKEAGNREFPLGTALPQRKLDVLTKIEGTVAEQLAGSATPYAALWR